MANTETQQMKHREMELMELTVFCVALIFVCTICQPNEIQYDSK